MCNETAHKNAIWLIFLAISGGPLATNSFAAGTSRREMSLRPSIEEEARAQEVFLKREKKEIASAQHLFNLLSWPLSCRSPFTYKRSQGSNSVTTSMPQWEGENHSGICGAIFIKPEFGEFAPFLASPQGGKAAAGQRRRLNQVPYPGAKLPPLPSFPFSGLRKKGCREG